MTMDQCVPLFHRRCDPHRARNERFEYERGEGAQTEEVAARCEGRWCSDLGCLGVRRKRGGLSQGIGLYDGPREIYLGRLRPT